MTTQHTNPCECFACGSERVEERLESHAVHTESGDILVPGFRYSLCLDCGQDFATAPQSRLNKRHGLAAVKRHEGYLTGEEIAAFRERHRLTQAEAAMLFMSGANAFSKYENELITQTRAMDLLMRVADAVPNAMQWLKRYAGMYPTISAGIQAPSAGSKWLQDYFDTSIAANPEATSARDIKLSCANDEEFANAA